MSDGRYLQIGAENCSITGLKIHYSRDFSKKIFKQSIFNCLVSNGITCKKGVEQRVYLAGSYEIGMEAIPAVSPPDTPGFF